MQQELQVVDADKAQGIVEDQWVLERDVEQAVVLLFQPV
jgi:hypothetical protein